MRGNLVGGVHRSGVVSGINVEGFDMLLWLIKPKKGSSFKKANEDYPWDRSHGFVIRAKTRDVARILASKEAGNEGKKVWIDPDSSTCEILKNKGSRGIVLRDFNAA